MNGKQDVAAPSVNVSMTTLAFSEQDLAQGVTHWMIANFGSQLSDAVKTTPLSVPLLCAIACREAGAYWLPLTTHMTAAQVLGLCVYDASGDYLGTTRSAFPTNRAQFQLAYGATFTNMLVDEANKARAARGLAPGQYLYKGYGIFQYDLQFVRSDQNFFQSKLWYDFTECVSRAVAELKENYAKFGDVQEAVRAYNGSGPSAEQYAQDVMRLLPFCEAAAAPAVPAATPVGPPSLAARFQSSQPPAPSFTVHHGKYYRATITLNGIEQFASNGMIADKMTQYGFANVTVTGSGATRIAEGLWTGPDTTAQIDPHLSNVVELPDPPVAAQGLFPAALTGLDRSVEGVGVAAPAIVKRDKTQEMLPAQASPSGKSLVMSNAFTSASLPTHHDGMLVVKVRDESLSSAAPMMISAMAEMSASSLSPGLGALSFFERAGKIKRVTPLRRDSERMTQSLGISVVSALTFTPTAAAEKSEVHDGISFIELEQNQDTAQLQTALANDPSILSVSKVPVRYLAGKAATRKPAEATIAAVPPSSSIMWNLQKIAWDKAREQPGFRDANSIKVAVLDTGVDEFHPSLKGQIAAYHWQQPDMAVSGNDFIGHGTHVSGTIAAVIGSASVKGICKCTLSVWKIFGDTAVYQPSLGAYGYYVDPILYRRALAACVENPVDVINLSIGGTAPPDPTSEGFLFSQLIASGVTICAAMGNDRGAGSPIFYPAAIPGIIAVGATGPDDLVAEFSNAGSHIALSAPGKAIWSTLPTYPGQTGFNAVIGPDGKPQQSSPISREKDYDAWDGTSMATPHVTACTALLMAKHNNGGGKLTPDQARKLLMQSADKVQGMNGSDFSPDYGAGRLDLLNLLQESL
jgi:subtilisin family serine protease